MHLSIQANALYFQSHRLFVDLDGVLVDFEGGVEQALGRTVDSFHPRNELWKSVSAIPEFYANLPWTSDGKFLWSAVKNLCPSILTGVPRGNWAEPQKRAWCRKNIGEDIEVFVCLSSEKSAVASGVCDGELTPILIDDRNSLREGWEHIGGIFIHHRNTEESLQELQSHLKQYIHNTDRDARTLFNE